MANDENNPRQALKSIIRESRYIDDNDELLNEILVNGLDGLYKFREDIAPKSFKCLELSLRDYLAKKNKCTATVFNPEKTIKNSLKLTIEVSDFIDTNDILLNAILEEGIKGLYKHKDDIPPRIFMKLESSVGEILTSNTKSKYNQDSNSHQISFSNFIVNQLRVLNVPSNLHIYIQEQMSDRLSNIIKSHDFCITGQNIYDMLYSSLSLNHIEDVKNIRSFLEKLWRPVEVNEELKLTLLNKITLSCLEVLKNFEHDIPTKVFKKLKNLINEISPGQDFLKKEGGIYSDVNKSSSKQCQVQFSDEIINKLKKQKERISIMPDCFEKSVLNLIYLIRLEILPDNNITNLFKKQEEPINFDTYLLSLNESYATEGRNFNNEIKENLQRAVNLIKMGHLNSALQILESLFKQIQPLDITEITLLLEKAYENFNLIENRDVILLLGMTGSGKTATIHFLSGSKMVEKQVEIKPGKFLNHITAAKPLPDALSKFVISFRAESETRYINPIQINLKDLGAFTDKFIMLCDSPRFGDTAGPEVDIANSISIVEGIKCCKSVRPVILMNYENQGGRGEGIREMTRMIQDMVINIEEYLSTFSYIFTKYPDIDIHTSLLNIYISVEKISEQNDETFKAILEDMLKKTKKNGKSLDLINDNPLDVLNKIIKTPCIDDPKRVFKYTMTERSKNALYMQAEYNKSAIICAAKTNNYKLIKYKIVELIFLFTTLKLNEVRQTLKESIDFVNTHIERCYEDTKQRLSRCLDNQSKLSLDELEYYVSQIEKFKDLHIFTDVEPLVKVSRLSEALVQNLRLRCDQEAESFTSLNIFHDEYSKTSLYNLKLISEKCDNKGYISACQFVIDQVNIIQTNLESCLEANDFNASANLLQLSKIICSKFNGHENLEMQITSVYENNKVSVISKLK
ncbi:uncharacterized protein LOC136095850 isoform X2 [Hydra vulgaris]